MALNIVLVEPEIPQNAGNIARTAAVTGCKLHLVRPLGFEVSDKYLKRAGLDYWHLVDIYYYDSIEEVMDKFYNGKNFWFFSTKAKNIHSEVNYKDQNWLLVFKYEYTHSFTHSFTIHYLPPMMQVLGRDEADIVAALQDCRSNKGESDR